MKRLNILVICGGTSPEADVSRQTGKALFDSCKRLGHNATLLDIPEIEFMKTPDMLERFDLVVVGYHGTLGEDGHIQAYLETVGIPFTGSGMMASSICMNKELTKRILEDIGIPTPPWSIIGINDNRTVIGEKISHLHYPLFVKPNSQGSTIGGSFVENSSSLLDALHLAFQYSRKAIVEEYISGRELAVGIVGETVLPPLEIVPKGGLYDYKHKYQDGLTEYIVPANIPELVAASLKRDSWRAFTAIGCSGYARADIRYDGKRYYFLEINSLPGMTSHSLVPKAAAAIGMGFDNIAEKIIDEAINPRRRYVQ